MNPITPPIKPGDQGPAVTNLQEALIFLFGKKPELFALANLTPEQAAAFEARIRAEQTTARFDQVTAEALRRFQKVGQIEPTGVVDQRTADAINAALRDLGALGAAASDELAYVVQGTVTSPDRAGVGGLQVQIVDKNVGPDVPLAQATTDNRGHYTASFAATLVTARGKTQPDLQARVQAGETFVGASEVRYNANVSETLDVLLPANAAALPSEHETLTGALSSHFTGKLADLKEDNDRQDITYLANKTGWDARAVAMAALADQFSQQTVAGSTDVGIPAPFYYALFRAGLPADANTLYQTDAATVGRVWKQAIGQGVIPAAMAQQIDGATNTFQNITAQKLLTGPALVGVSSVKELLNVSGINDGDPKLQQFADLYAANGTDMPKFWDAVTAAFGADTAKRLQVDGKLAYLTINNAPLMQKIHTAVGANGLSDPLQLAQMGYHRAAQWNQLLGADVPIPNEIPGDTPDTKRANYANYLAAQVRLNYPTAAVAQMVQTGELPLTGAPAGVADQVNAFLTEHQGKFEIGMHPIQQYIRDNNLTDADVAPETVKQVMRLQRVYQITPSDDALIGLMKRGVDAAYHVVAYDKATFVQSLAIDLGGADQAALVYDRSVQVHSTVLNIALSYLNARTAPAIGVHSPAGSLDPTPAHTGDIIAYATLEKLFGSMDFCACDHCRSILSPAAYLVDLLLFLDQPNRPAGGDNPQSVLLNRRPDIQHLPLTCENTNTALPYIDVVNETLEYYIANGLTLEKRTLDEYAGHDTGGAASEDLLASPQFVIESAYTTLSKERFPAPLPFHQPLEKLRRYFNKFEVRLPLAMERLRKDDLLDVDRTTNPPPPITNYGWRDILMEELQLSRAEYEILTVANTTPNQLLWPFYGYPAGTSDDDIINGNQAANIVALSNAKQFTRRVGITYEDLISILRTRFINPNSDLIPKVEKLGVTFSQLKDLNASTATGQAWLDLLPQPSPDATEFGGDIEAWVKNPTNYSNITGLITLTVPAEAWASVKQYFIGDCVRPTSPPLGSTIYYECTQPGKSGAAEPKQWPSVSGETCSDGTLTWTCLDVSNSASFANMAFRYADTLTVTAVDFVRILRFIRLWKKLGWTIEQIDVAICSLYRADLTPLGEDDIDTVTNLDPGFRILLPRLGVIRRVMNTLNLTPKSDLLPLLACFAPISTHDNLAWLPDSEGGLQQQIVPSLYRQMFLNPTVLQQDPVFADNGYGEFLQRVQVPYSHSQPTLEQPIRDAAPGRISYDNINKQLSFSGSLSATVRNALNAIPGVTQDFKAAVDALYTSQFLGSHIGALRGAFNITDQEFLQIAEYLSLVVEVTAPLNLSVAYTHSQASLGQDIAKIAPQLNYDSVGHNLSCPGALDTATRDALKKLPGVSQDFKDAVDALTLDPALVDVAPGLAYDSSRKELSYLGALSSATRDALNGAATKFKISPDFNKTVDVLIGKSDDPATLTPLSLAHISQIFRYGWLARRLKLSVRELLLLIQFTGLDPFAAPDPTNPAILQLISLVQALKDLSFKSAAALYLIWNQDLSGKSAPDPAQVGAFARAQRLDFEAIETEFAIIDDPDGAVAQTRMALVYGADEAAFFFGLLNNTLTTDVPYSRDQANLVTTVTYDYGQATLDQAIQAIIDAAQGLIAYDDASKQLSFTGAMSANIRDKLKTVAGVTAEFQAAIDSLYAENETLIKANLEQPIVDSAPGRIAYDDFRKRLSYAGVLTATTRDALTAAATTTLSPKQAVTDFNTAVGTLYAENQKSIGPFFARYPELQPLYDAYTASNEPIQTKRSELLSHILPELVKRRKQEQALQAMSAAAQTTLDFARALLDTSSYGNALHAADDKDKSALDDILSLETRGLSVQFFAHDTATGAMIPAPDNIAPNLDYAPAVGGDENPLPANPTAGAAISGVWSGYIEGPENGLFNLYIEADASATVTLLLDDKPVTLAQNATLWNNTDPIELRAGTLYSFNLTVEKVQNIVRVQWEWEPKGQGRDVIPSRYLYPATLFDTFQETYIRFLKAASLATGLGLTANELSYFATHSDYQIKGDGWLNALSVIGDPAPETATALLRSFEALLDFARIKSDISPSDESLLAVLRDPVTATQTAVSLLFTITRWNQTSLNDVLAQFSGTIAGLEHFELFRGVYDAFALIQKMGISAKALIQATTNEPTADTVRDLQAALRARYDQASWRDVVRPINDEMRSLQRDALVAYILRQMLSDPDSADIDTPDKLFEYFLMDVQMDPCMQTSRIRHALSSVQLFIERCFMNLESSVSPGAFNDQQRKQWEWMKRYRVWEANRKVYLYPENWLEPELRDDQSPFFKETMSELLQSDITEDSAATALLNYLSKLEEVAKLEPSGIYYIAANQASRIGEVAHVVARTAGAHPKYYYRRKEYGYWTPWEQIKLDIEDNPVIPVVWSDRLLLFWLRILKKGPDKAQKPPAGNITSMDLKDVPSETNITVQAVLCWSEYYNGKWQATKTSPIQDPAELGSLTGFDRSTVRLSVFEEGDALRIYIGNGPSFLLYNTHSAPVLAGALTAPAQHAVSRNVRDDSDMLHISYNEIESGSGPGYAWANETTKWDNAVVHEGGVPTGEVVPCNSVSDLMDTTFFYDSPFFFWNSRHAFYVETKEEPMWIWNYPKYHLTINSEVAHTQAPPLVLQPGPLIPQKFLSDGGPIGTNPGVVDTAPMRSLVTEDAYIRQGIGTTGVVMYNGAQVGPSGVIKDTKT